MPSITPEQHYLKDVLGIQSIVWPEQLKAISRVLVIADKILSTGEAELLKKMLGSIEIQDYEIVVGEPSAELTAGRARGLVFISNGEYKNSTALLPSVQIKNFYAMTSADSHPAETQAYKKAAWAELQNFKKKVNG